MTKNEQRRLIKRRQVAESGKRYDLEAILIAFDNHNTKHLQEVFDELHTIDLVDMIQELPRDLGAEVLMIVGEKSAGDILDDLPVRVKKDLFRQMDAQTVQNLLHWMATDDIADFLASLKQQEAEELLSGMDPEERQEMQELLLYPPQSAGGLMSTEYVAFPRELTVDEALNRLPEEGKNADLIYYVYLLDSHKRLVGAISLRELILARPEDRLGDLAKTNLVRLRTDCEQDEAVDVLQHYNLLAVPVVDREMVLRGIITHDDIADIISAEATEDLYSLAGLRLGEEDEDWDLSSWQRAKRRLPWLLICIFGGILSGQVISQFSDALTLIVSLAFFIPVQMDTAGNVATQSVAIVVRGLATGELDDRRIWSYALREMMIGLYIGIVCGGILALSAMFLWQEGPRLGLAVGGAMSLTLVVSALLGSAFPLFLNRFGVDPAVASGPLVSTVLDAIGLVIYFLSAVLFLGVAL